MSENPVRGGAARLVQGLALVMILVGFVVNRFTLGVLASDGEISGGGKALIIGAFQVCAILMGAGLLLGPRGARSGRPAIVLVALAGLGFAGWATFLAPTVASKQRALLVAINRSEDLIQALNAEIVPLKSAPLNLALPDARSRDLFDERVKVVDLASAGESEAGEELRGLARSRPWTVESKAAEVTRDEVDIWRPFFDEVAYLDTSSIYIVRGAFLTDDEFEMDLGFSARAHLKTGEVAQASAKMVLVWHAHDGDDGPVWRIAKWKTKKFETTVAASPFFTEVLDEALDDPGQLERARRSLHEEMIVRGVVDEDFELPEHFKQWSQGQHPGVSVVDIDADGLDDFYVMPRRGRNMLFRNLGDGRFEDVAPRYGLDVDGETTCAVFADFDNDGDPDAFLGRSVERSMYLVNDGERFTDRSEELVGEPLPYYVTSAAASDYDGDGLLDVYLSTYSIYILSSSLGAAMMGGEIDGIPELPFFSEEDSAELHRRRLEPGAHMTRNAPGPPNLLFRNTGGAFERSEASGDLETWRHTFQSTFGDYDGDGDQDLYVANDFAPNNLFRNDDGRFVDVTEETGSADIGFGMGAAWGDYDNDGAQDIYVSNMFSKAGRRIMSQIEGLDPRFVALARGNSLLRNEGGEFEKVSGMEEPHVLVEKAGWSWGSQFLDVNNDGYLDIYALSGFYTAPKQFRLAFDT
jgi:hypothetical protein